MPSIEPQSALKYVGMILTSGIWISSDIYFLVKLNELKKQNKNKECEKTEMNISKNLILLIGLLMIDFVYKYKVVSMAGNFSKKIGNIITIGIVTICVLPTFLSCNIVQNSTNVIYSPTLLNSLIAYHSLSMILKVILLVLIFLPQTKDTKMMKFMVSPILTFPKD